VLAFAPLEAGAGLPAIFPHPIRLPAKHTKHAKSRRVVVDFHIDDKELGPGIDGGAGLPATQSPAAGRK
jgi:hypothetical protein